MIFPQYEGTLLMFIYITLKLVNTYLLSFVYLAILKNDALFYGASV